MLKVEINQTYHQFSSSDHLEAGVVLNLIGSSQLSTGRDAKSEEALVEYRLELSTGGVDGGSMRSRAGADDDEFRMHAALICQG